MPEAIALENERLRLRVSPQGGAVLDGFTSDGRPFLRPCEGSSNVFDVHMSACFPLVPIGNRVEGNAFDFRGKRYAFRPNTDEPNHIHGDGWLGRWTVEESGPLSVRLSFAQAAPDKSPHVYRAEQSIRLDDNHVRLDLSVRNLGDEALPFGIGFHPYFLRTPDVRLEAPAHWWWSEADNHLPVERQSIPAETDFTKLKDLPARWLNNCYEDWNGRARVVWPDCDLTVAISADEVFSRCMIYAPDDDKNFICVEPMSHAPNALAKSEPLGLQVLEPGQMLKGGFTMTVSDWSAPDD